MARTRAYLLVVAVMAVLLGMALAGYAQAGDLSAGAGDFGARGAVWGRAGNSAHSYGCGPRLWDDGPMPQCRRGPADPGDFLLVFFLLQAGANDMTEQELEEYILDLELDLD
jgi:hypothetical protein